MTVACSVHKVESLIPLPLGQNTCKLNFLQSNSVFDNLNRFCYRSEMRLFIFTLQMLLLGFVPAQTLSTSTNSLNTGESASSASAASVSSVMASETSTFSTDAGHGSLTSTNPNSVTQSDFGHGTATSSPFSSAQSTAGNGRKSASTNVGTGTGASATPTGSSDGNNAAMAEGPAVLLAAVAFVMLWM
jgi:hypothetical protein